MTRVFVFNSVTMNFYHQAVAAYRQVTECFSIESLCESLSFYFLSLSLSFSLCSFLLFLQVAIIFFIIHTNIRIISTLSTYHQLLYNCIYDCICHCVCVWERERRVNQLAFVDTCCFALHLWKSKKKQRGRDKWQAMPLMTYGLGMTHSFRSIWLLNSWSDRCLCHCLCVWLSLHHGVTI